MPADWIRLHLNKQVCDDPTPSPRMASFRTLVQQARTISRYELRDPQEVATVQPAGTNRWMANSL